MRNTRSSVSTPFGGLEQNERLVGESIRSFTTKKEHAFE